MGRRTKGTNLVGLVRMLKGALKSGQVAQVPPEVARLLAERIIVTEWYPFDSFLAVLDIVHRELAGGTDEGAVRLGEMGAHLVHEGSHSAFIKAGDPARSLEALDRIWPLLLDFGDLVSERVAEGDVRFTVTGYRDMPRAHGMTLIGWVRAVVTLAGGTVQEVIVERGPWRGDPDFSGRARFTVSA